MTSFQRCVELDPDDENSLTMYLGALCELKKEKASLERNRKLDNTQRKLDQFYENMEMLQKLQQPFPQSSEFFYFVKCFVDDLTPAQQLCTLPWFIPNAVHVFFIHCRNCSL